MQGLMTNPYVDSAGRISHTPSQGSYLERLIGSTVVLEAASIYDGSCGVLLRFGAMRMHSLFV